MKRIPDCVQGTAKVVEVLGYWPSFHDAEIISFSAKRAAPDRDGPSSACLCVHVFRYEETGAGTADYAMVCTASLLIEFLFNDLRDLSLEEFNRQNVINALGFTILSDQSVEVVIDSIWGMGGLIRCGGVEVGGVTRLV